MNVPATGALCSAIAQSRRIHVGDVLALRHSLLASGVATRAEAESLFDLAAQNLPACAQWREFFIEAVASCLCGGNGTPASLAEADAEWLIAMIGRAPLDERLEFELMAKVMRTSLSCPSILMRFVLVRLNAMSDRASDAEAAQPAFEAARAALQAAGLAGRLYVPRQAPQAAPEASAKDAAAA